ncbi:MAG: phosphotransferase [Anaerolineae bacterium]|nr:phosphotransferase [Anaerolineae bacterium]
MKLLKPQIIRKKIKAKLSPANLPLDRINEVWGYYDLGVLEQVRSPDAGKRSDTVLIKSSKGNFALKAYTPHLGQDGILFEHSVIQFLQTVNYPTPGLIENRLGQTVTHMADRSYACYKFAKGERYTDYFLSPKTSELMLRQSARALAEYHLLIKDFLPDGHKAEGFQPGTCQRERGKDWYLNELALVYTVLFYNNLEEASRLMGKKVSAIMDQWLTIQSEFIDLHDRLEGVDPPPLPILAIHGDFGPYNLLFHRNKLSAVLDFECTHLDWRLTDVLSALVRFCRRRQGDLNQAMAATFLANYQSIWPLEPAEIEAAQSVFKLARYHNVIKALSKYRLTGQEDSLQAAEASLAQILSPGRLTLADTLGCIFKGKA